MKRLPFVMLMSSSFRIPFLPVGRPQHVIQCVHQPVGGKMSLTLELQLKSIASNMTVDSTMTLRGTDFEGVHLKEVQVQSNQK